MLRSPAPAETPVDLAQVAEVQEAPSLERAFSMLTDTLEEREVLGGEIDAITPIKIASSGGKYGPERHHLLFSLAIEGTRDVFWYSPAAIGEGEINPNLTIVNKPGLGEIIENGIGWSFHKRVADRNTDASVLTHATHGVGPHGERYNFWELTPHRLDRMAERGRWMLHTYLKDERLALVGISMGTRIFHKLLIEERAENPESQLDIAAIINCAPALVVVERIFMDMGLKFPLHMTVDGFLEVFRRTNPKYYAELMHTLTGSKPGIKDIPPMLVQIYDLLQGVEIEDIKANAARYPTAVVVGERDTVGQPTMWSDIPDVITKIIPKRGHGIALKTREGADSVTSMLDLLDARGNPFTRAEAS